MVLEDYLLAVVEEAAFAAKDEKLSPEAVGRVEAVRRMLECGERHRLSLGEPMSRALLHEGHRF